MDIGLPSIGRESRIQIASTAYPYHGAYEFRKLDFKRALTNHTAGRVGLSMDSVA